ncbi:MAG: acetate--CoA ligase family protein [Bacillota bacterium]
MNSQEHGLNSFFRPNSIAIVGASQDLTSISGKPLKFLKDYGYRGDIFLVNPKYSEIYGVACYPSIKAIPGQPDLALFAVAYHRVLPALEECAEKGIKNVIIFSSGFAETGAEGARLQKQIKELARASGIRVCGPNCQGMVNLADSITASFSAALENGALLCGPVGFATQSGALGYSTFNQAQEAGIGFTYIVNTGNEADLTTLDAMEFMVEDDSTRVILGYLEGVPDSEQFKAVAERALALGKPLVLLKAGRSAIGSRAASSHTAALTGSDAAFQAVCRQKGIVRVNDIEELLDMAKVFAPGKLPQGNRLCVISTSGGAGIIAADTCADLDLDLPDLLEESYDQIKEFIPSYGSARNPIDITAQVINDPTGFRRCVEVVLADPNVDCLMIVQTMITGSAGEQVARDIVDVMGSSTKPVVIVWTAGDVTNQRCFQILKQGGVPYFKAPGRGVRAIKALVDYASFAQAYKNSSLQAQIRPQVLSEQELQRVRELLADGGTLSEHQAKKVLKYYGLPMPGEGLATNEEDAVALAQEIGYPVVMKIESPQILHKTEAKGVILNIFSPQEVREAFRTIVANAKEYNPDAEIWGVLVQEMIGKGVEAIIGVNNDPVFGPVVMFGLGGIFVEVFKDVSMRPAPLSKRDAMEMIMEIKGYPLMAGFRGRGKGDIAALAEVLITVSHLAVDLKDDLAELDINPLIVLPEGQGVRLADALIIAKKHVRLNVFPLPKKLA